MDVGLISPGGENLLDFLELRQVLSTYDGDLRDPLWRPQERPAHSNQMVNSVTDAFVTVGADIANVMVARYVVI